MPASCRPRCWPSTKPFFGSPRASRRSRIGGAFPLRERMLRLRPDLLDLETLVANYDRSILYKCNVVLTQDIVAAGLRASGIGTVVMVHANGAAYEVEFMTLGGKRWPS